MTNCIPFTSRAPVDRMDHSAYGLSQREETLLYVTPSSIARADTQNDFWIVE